MTVAVWRIPQAARSFVANDLTGTGAKLTGGSWNNSGVPLVYASSNIAVAAQETLSYLGGPALRTPPPYN